MGGYAWVTLATNDSYSLGALVLAHSLKKSKTAHKSVVLITPAVSQPMREQLQTVFDVIKVVDVLDSKDEAHLALMQRPELGITFTKIHCWRLVEFDKCVFLDADTLVIRNCDELFEKEEFSAAPDVSWPDCFNSGVFVYKPSVQTFNELLQFAVEKGSFDGGDQGLLNQFFSGWATEDIKKHLPFVYNLTSVAAYSYIPAFKHYGSETRIVHFIGAGKPWLQQLDPATRTITPTSGSEHLAPMLQQWWDLFCEKVHPNLNKNLESNNDGMSHPPVAACCSNSVPIALTDDSQTPRLIEPCTPYREKDDFRQYNLPYQPFDVKGSSGELLNVEFLLASVGHLTPPEVILDERQGREGDEMEKKDEPEERNETEEKSDLDVKENESRQEEESPEIVSKRDRDFRLEERTSEWKEAGIGEQNQEQEKQEQSKEPEQPPLPVHPFDYDSFFPDESCINKYLEQNVITYQPYDGHTNHQQHENHHQTSCENDDSQHPHENNREINLGISDPQPPEDPVPSLPRFLTIPENDKRQSGNTDTHLQTKQAEDKRDLPQTDPATGGPGQALPQQEGVGEKRELIKSKSMPYLRYDVTEVPSSGSIWKSQPNVNVDPNRKYSMPKLKPILPRQNSLSKSVPSIIPKVTLYTEFLMSSEYKDPADLPKDKVGFVETLIHKKGQLRRSKSAADIGDKFGPLPYIFSPETEQPAVLKKMPLTVHLDNELYDLSQCKRQMGNKPKTRGADQRKENNHSLPALKPLVPPKDKKSTLIKKRKSKELSPGDGGREKIFKREPKMPKERKRECKTTPRNVSEAAGGSNVNEILSRLREFSKNYEHFFGVVPHLLDRTIKCKNVTVQADELAGSEWDTSEWFLKTSSPGVTAVSRATQTPREDKSEKERSAVDPKFRHFRNYVKEKSKTSQKGLLSLQDLVSKPTRREDKVTENVKASIEISGNCSEPERGSERVFSRKVGDLVDDAVERKDSVKGDGVVERKTPEKGIRVNYQSSTKGDEIEEDHQGSRELCKTTENEDNVEDNSKRTVKNASHSKWWRPKEVETNIMLKNSGGSDSSPSDKSKSKGTVSDHSEKDISEPESLPVVSGTGGAVLSSRERETQRNRLGGEPKSETKTSSPGIESIEDPELNVGESAKRSVSLKFDSCEDAVRTQPTPSSCSDRLTPKSKAAEPVRLTPTGKEPEEETLSKLSTETSAGMSGPEGILSEGNQLKTKTNGKMRSEASSEDGGAQTNSDKLQETPDPSYGKEEQTEEKGSLDKLKNTDEVLFNAPRSSLLPLRSHASEVIEEMIAKATSQQSQTSVSPCLENPRKTPRPMSPPRKLSGHPPQYRNSPPSDSPDGTSPPAGERTSPAAGKLSPPSPSIPSHGNALPESHKDMKLSSGIAGAIAQLSLEAGSDQNSQLAAAASTAHQEYVRRQNWETGNMDYMGRDSFDNIWSKICQTVEGKESEEEGPAAVSSKQLKESLDPSATTSTEEERTFDSSPPVAEPPSFLPTVLQKCPEYIETLPGEPAAGSVEDDEIIFSKLDNRNLTNITEVEEDGKESSTLGAKSAEAGKVKLSDILQPEAKAPVQKATERADVEAPAGEKSEKPQEKPEVTEVKPEPEKVECQTVAICQLSLPSRQVASGGGTNISKISGPEKKTEECTTVAIPSPPIAFPGTPFTEKDKKAQSRSKPEKTREEKFEPIPLPPPETPTYESAAKTSDSSKDQGKQKKGVFTKILEMVGVSPKDKNEDEISKSVFYDVEGAAASKQEPAKDENGTIIEPEKQASTETKAVSPKQVDDMIKSPDDVAKLKPEEMKETQEKVVTAKQSKDTEEVSLGKSEEAKKETVAKPPEAGEAESSDEQKPHDPNKSDTKQKHPMEKPARNVSSRDPTELPKNSIQISPKSKSPSPRLTLPKEPPETAITTPTPSPQQDFPVRKSSGLLRVDERILETPPIPEPPKEGLEEAVKGRVLTEVEDIIGKAKSEVESRLQERRSAEKESGESSDLINAMKLMVGSEQAAQAQAQAQAQSPEVQMEELRVTSEEERMRHKGEVVSSKLSDQILKAIPPPRRKAISEGSASTSAIPTPPPAPEQKSVSGETKPKTAKPSSIPVPPPRNRGKPTQPASPKGKGKK